MNLFLVTIMRMRTFSNLWTMDSIPSKSSLFVEQRKCCSQPIPGQKPGDFQSDTKINIKFTIRYSINQLLLLLLRTKSC